MTVAIPAGDIFPARPIKPRLVTAINTVGPTSASAAFILNAVSTRPYFNISMAAVNSIVADSTLIPAMPKTIFSVIKNSMFTSTLELT